MPEVFEPKRLRRARTFLGLPLGDLGDRIGASRQFLHQLETGDRTPNAETVAALASVLLVERNFFFSEPNEGIAQERCNFRSLASSRVRDLEQVISHAELLAELLRYLETVLEFPVADFPQAPASDMEGVEQAAEYARTHWGLTTDQPITSTIRVAETAGAVVVRFPGVAKEIDALSVQGTRPIIIRSSDKQSPTRLRFDLAHELGHLVMHRDAVHLEHDERESQAHRFASAFLLPRKAFTREWPPSRYFDWQAVFAIKRRWTVSAQAIIRRAFDLGLIDAAQYRTGNVYISRQGYKRNEPCEPEVSEQPEMLRTALIELQRSEGLLPKDVARKLGVQPVFLGKLLGIDIPNLAHADTLTVVNFNARLDWAKAKWLP
ncbi:MAG: XRE family transcriptional regulator [Gammaproteobacteria bacterium]